MEASSALATKLVDETSVPFVGRWQTLVSTTNWEKGRIICQWREALREAGAPASHFSDDAWSRRLGTISSQHTGRLRRTFLRFGDTYGEYQGLYWSHFQSALEWDDAEMWLEGAVQNRWSVSEMRDHRAQTLGGSPAQPHDSQIISEEFDSDQPQQAAIAEIPDTISARSMVIAEEENFSADEGEEEAFESADEFAAADIEKQQTVRPFARLAELPADLSEAFESFKLAILRHKLAGWDEVGREDVLAALEALKQLALASN